MEPFELTLSQVNFEEEDLNRGGHDDLHSFSNTFSFHDDFKDVDTTVEKPVSAKRLQKFLADPGSSSSQRPQSSLIDLIETEGRKHYTTPPQPLQPPPLLSTSSAASAASSESQERRDLSEQERALRDSVYLDYRDHRSSLSATTTSATGTTTATTTTTTNAASSLAAYNINNSCHGNQVNTFGDGVTLGNLDTYKSAVYRLPGEKKSKQKARDKLSDGSVDSVAIEPSGSSFHAFTDTVDALALQESVIGKAGVTPASAEEIAKAIAATQQLLGQTHSEDDASATHERVISDSEETTPSLTELLPTSGATPVHTATVVPIEELPLEDDGESVLVAEKQQGGKYSIYMTDGKTTSESAYSHHTTHHSTSATTTHTSAVTTHSAATTSASSMESHSAEVVHEVRTEVVPGGLSREGSVKSNHSGGGDSGAGGATPGLAQNLHAVKPPGRNPPGGDGEVVDTDAQFIAIPHGNLIRIPADQLTVTAERSASSWFSRSATGGATPPTTTTTTTNVSPRTSPREKKDARGELEAALDKTTDDKTTDYANMETPADVTNTETRDSPGESAPETGDKITDSAPENLQTSAAVLTETTDATDANTAHGKDVSMVTVSDDTSLNDSVQVTCDTTPPTTSTPLKSSSTTASRVSHSATESISHVQSVSGVSYNTTTTTNQDSSVSSVDTSGTTHTERSTTHSTSVDVSHIVEEHTVNQTYTQRPEVAENSDFKMYLHMSEELAKVTREKARLEGLVEMLETDARGTLTERAELQTQAASLAERLRTYESSQVGIVGDRNALAADLETLRQDRVRLEQVAVDASKLMQEKDAEIAECRQDIRQGHEAQDKLQDQIKHLKREMTSRDNTAQDLKSKIAELYVEFQTCNQNKILAESEIKSLASEIKSLSTGKEWYQDQLHAVQESKSQLQRDITKVKSEMIAQSTMIEKLKVENIRVKQYLSETEQRGLREKEMLARHLEAIELDMVDREAAFAQIQAERQSMESALQQRTDELPPDLAEEFRKSKNELRRTHAQAASLEHERAELVKRIALAQESIADRDRSMEEADRKLVDLEVTLKQTQLEVTTKDEENQRVMQEKAVMEVNLSRAKEEKVTFDNALHTLKVDMAKVEHSFKVMKTELSDKQSELEKLRVANESLRERVTRAEDEAPPAPEAVRESVQTSAAAPTTNHVPYKVDPSLLEELERLRQREASLREQVALLQNQSSDSIQVLISQQDALDAEVTTLKRDLSDADTAKLSLVAEKDEIQRDLMSTKERILELDLNFQNVFQERENLRVQLSSAVPDTTPTTPPPQTNGAQVINENAEKYEKENDALRSQLAKLQTESHRQIAKLKAKSLKLGKDLEAALKQHRNLQKETEQSAAGVTGQVTTLEEQKSQLQEQLALLQQKFSLDLDDKTQRLQTELQTYQQEVHVLREHKQEVEKRLHEQTIIRERLVEEYTTRITIVERELVESREYIQVNQEKHRESEQLEIQLERERGRLAGLQANYETLKEHAGRLETQLAVRESSAVAASSQVTEQLQRSGREIVDLREGQTLIEQQLDSERQGADELRKQLAKEKESHAKLRRETEQLWLEHDQMRVDVEQKGQTIVTMVTEKELLRQRELELKMEMEKLNTEQQGVAMERERLQREVDERQARDPFIQEQINTMQWQMSEKSSEIENLQTRVKMAEERRDMEVSSLKQTLQSTTSELNELREELASTKVDRTNQQTKVSELKHTLKTLLEHTKTLHSHESVVKSMPLPIDLSKMETLLLDNISSTTQSKPISFLKATLSGLRGEISILQVQAAEHIEAIQTSNKAWEELDEQVNDLREICRTSAADRAASEKLLLETASVTSLTSDSGVLPLDGAPIKLADLNLGAGQSGTGSEPTNDIMRTLKAMNLLAQSEGSAVIYTGETNSVTLSKKQ